LRITWCGHSYFMVEAGGLRVAMDPHDGDSLGLPRCRAQADLVLVSHDHYDHNAVELASSPRTRVVRWREGELSLGGLRVRGVRLGHDDKGGSLFGSLVAYVVEAEGLALAHMSDVGEPSDSAERVGRADIAIVPAGDVTTVSQDEAVRWAVRLGARLVLPAHYWVPGSNVPLDPLDRLLEAWRGRVERVSSSSVTVDAASLPQEPTLLVLEPPKDPSGFRRPSP